MEIRDLLNRDIVCECGRTHRCDISTVEIGQNALDTLPEATKGYRSILLVADQNTYPLCGERVRALLGDRITSVCLYPQKSLLIPDERAAAVLESHLRPDTDLILGIGGAAYYGLLQFDKFRTTNELMLVGGLLVLVIVGIFWLQGFLWYGIVKFFKARNQIEGQ